VSDDPYLHDYFRRFRAPADENGAGRSVLFLVGSSGISGGTYVILQHAKWLLDHGWDVVLGVRFPDAGAPRWHPALEQVPILSIPDAAAKQAYDLAVATWWPTVFELPEVDARHYAYLVQSAEARFYGDIPEEQWAQPLAELTYTFGIPIITIATWLQVYLAARHGAPSFLVRNGIRKDLYNPLGPTLEPRHADLLRVLVEGPAHVPMKNTETAARLARAGGADEIWHLTGQGSGLTSLCDRTFEQVPVEAVPTIYRSCDVLVKLSKVEGMFGPPLEMFHCGGTAVTYDVTGYEEYLNDENSIVVPTDDEQGVVDAIRLLKREPDRLRSMRHAALATASRWPDWEQSSSEFGRFVAALVRQPVKDRTQMMLAIRGAKVDIG
jgi:glycosyltransferase involved in cell wall biosynthesis